VGQGELRLMIGSLSRDIRLNTTLHVIQ